MENYHFSLEEVQAMYKLILYMGWTPHDEGDEEIINVIKHISMIVEKNELVTKYHKAT
jgi:hypothetical protein